MTLIETRRTNAIAIMKENALDEIEFALCLGREESEIASILSPNGKKISDSLARLMEQTFSKPKLWLDQGTADSASGPSFDLFG
ncbi:hypothetical protein HF888_07415 [Bermanella marisrubri]|uniref:Uncharacterized protein n=1 Tax=Bermanella marisrubri TaxID=207949 RepID=Q1N4X2_9GAMM|nr:hypothetical protein [Bermanella marisrubri]EAT13306.1 hypothetical protein RED65_01060 [Oceanobacter sp. RED65] [Bermanella marisrubri]QIZ84068.1 hypothetical protein HF888_07415 [Bermanella marisrubri]